MTDNAHFNYSKRAEQLNNFQGLERGTALATDIDGLIEYHNIAYVFFEVKYKDKELPFGQKLALERLVSDLGIIKPAIALVAEHNIRNPEEQVRVADCKVRELYYYKEKCWRKPKSELSVKQLLDSFFDCLEG